MLRRRHELRTSASIDHNPVAEQILQRIGRHDAPDLAGRRPRHAAGRLPGRGAEGLGGSAADRIAAIAVPLHVRRPRRPRKLHRGLLPRDGRSDLRRRRGGRRSSRPAKRPDRTLPFRPGDLPRRFVRRLQDRPAPVLLHDVHQPAQGQLLGNESRSDGQRRRSDRR